ncbi:MAG: acyl carrier protein [Betaproteobacteria bacterium]
MPTPQETLIADLKRLIVDACDKDIDPETISDDELLFGSSAPLALDSLDALQVSMALQKRFGVRLVDSKETRRILTNVAALAAYLNTHQ